MAGAYPGIGADEQWLYRLGELVLGPVNRDQLVEKLFTGELTAQTEVSRMGEGTFRRLESVDGFKLHIAKAEAKLRVEAKERADKDAALKRKTVILAALVGVAVLIATGAAFGARYLAIHNPWASADASLPDISVDTTITVAKAQGADEELLDYPLEPSRSGHRDHTSHAEHAERDHTPAKSNEHASRTVAAAGRTSAPDSEGLQIGEADQAAIHAVVSAHQKSLYPCLIAEAKRRPGLTGRIPIEFAVSNAGKVTKLWIDNPDFKNGPLADCMLKELQKWPFKPSGAGASVGLSFNIGHKG